VAERRAADARRATARSPYALSLKPQGKVQIPVCLFVGFCRSATPDLYFTYKSGFTVRLAHPAHRDFLPGYPSQILAPGTLPGHLPQRGRGKCPRATAPLDKTATPLWIPVERVFSRTGKLKSALNPHFQPTRESHGANRGFSTLFPTAGKPISALNPLLAPRSRAKPSLRAMKPSRWQEKGVERVFRRIRRTMSGMDFQEGNLSCCASWRRSRALPVYPIPFSFAVNKPKET